MGPSKIALLKDHPQSQTQLNGIIDKVAVLDGMARDGMGDEMAWHGTKWHGMKWLFVVAW